uniref:BRWD/PHIP N-terminal domain-containing protein n=1 Tax=Phlebotomus papatasi TaxID=29031 RepID=A0A1B0DJ82_PHLPP
MDNSESVKKSILTPELYFLISKFLSVSPLQDTKKVLVSELERHKILPKRIDWTGQEHDQTFAELVSTQVQFPLYQRFWFPMRSL